ncbi:MAG TPA: hypothetical protein VFX25_14780 [Streptosporangiaceae bacterium]|nr:hypothetical protein [Streptosporangiaceae bacterium]
MDELETLTGTYGWDRAFAQNASESVFDVPDWMRDMDHGRETAEDAQARALAREAEEWLSVAHLAG